MEQKHAENKKDISGPIGFSIKKNQFDEDDEDDFSLKTQ